jgi:pSer/pThr/pTyr-binding forkhead associated (FHA) protein
MAVILEVKAGPLTGKRVAVMGGQTVTVGRTDRANFSVPHDTFMSGVHFAVEYGPKGCVLTDKKSSNGTFVNGNRVAQTLLKGGDEIRSGETEFAVRFVDEESLISSAKSAKPDVAPLPLPARNVTKPPERATHIDSHVRKERSRSGPFPFASDARQQQLDHSTTPAAKSFIKIGNWTLAFVPDGWIEVGEYGIQRNARDVFPSNVVATEEQLGPGLSLQEYVESQLTMLRQYLRQPQIEASIPPKIHGAEESMAIEIRYQTKDGQAVFYRRVYVRTDRTVGVLALTTLQSELVQVRPIFDSILSAARFNPSANVER